jgi:hypothetical protein
VKPVFADTSYYVAFVNPADDRHKAAIEMSRELRRPIVLTEYVLAELGSRLSQGRQRRLLVELVEALRTAPLTKIVPASRLLFDRGLALFRRRHDKEWSLIDCISFEVMRSRRIDEALTTDHHFEQAGFRVLLM